MSSFTEDYSTELLYLVIYFVHLANIILLYSTHKSWQVWCNDYATQNEMTLFIVYTDGRPVREMAWLRRHWSRSTSPMRVNWRNTASRSTFWVSANTRTLSASTRRTTSTVNCVWVFHTC